MTYRLALLLVVLMCSWVAQANVDVYQFENDAQEQQYRDLIGELRCPKCQNQTIADSHAPLAQDLRERVYNQVKEGKSKAEIVDYMVARYGNFVTYRPPFAPSTYVLWIAPAVFLLMGVVLVIALTRKKNVPSATQLSAEEQAKLDALLRNSEEDQ